MEVFGTRRGAAACSTVHNILHSWGTRDPLDGGCVPLEPPLSEWHVWKLLWTPDRVAFYADDDESAPYWWYDKPDGATRDGYPYTSPQYLIANVAVGGNGPSQPLAAGALAPPGTQLHIDYVRVYALADEEAEVVSLGSADGGGGWRGPSTDDAVRFSAAGGLLLALGLGVYWRRRRRQLPAMLKEELLVRS